MNNDAAVDTSNVDTSNAVISCRHLRKSYTQGPQQVDVLIDINLVVQPGERVAIVGSSGSGKTTLLNMLGGLDLPSGGDIQVGGQNLAQLSEKQRGQLRNRDLGFVYQFHHLLGEFSALENVAMPLLIGGTDVASATQKATDLLTQVGRHTGSIINPRSSLVVSASAWQSPVPWWLRHVVC